MATTKKATKAKMTKAQREAEMEMEIQDAEEAEMFALDAAPAAPAAPAVTADQVLNAAREVGAAKGKIAATMRQWLDTKGKDAEVRKAAYKELLTMARTIEGKIVSRRDLPETEARTYSALTSAWNELHKVPREPNAPTDFATKVAETLRKWIAACQKAEDQKGLTPQQMAALIAAEKQYPKA